MEKMDFRCDINLTSSKTAFVLVFTQVTLKERDLSLQKIDFDIAFKFLPVIKVCHMCYGLHYCT